MNVTGVVVNWLTARRTLGAIRSFKKFYPDLPLIVVDDASDSKDKGEFYSSYGARDVNPDIDYDPDTDKLKIPGVEFIQAPNFGLHPKSHGNSVDLAIQKMTTPWMFHFHSDYRILKAGLVEELMDGLDETYAGAGDNKTRAEGLPALISVAAIYNAEAGKKNNLSFKPCIYYPDGIVGDLNGPIKDGTAVEAGSYFVGRLFQLGYRIKWVSNPHSRYGIHLRWNGNREEYDKYF